MDVQRTTVCLGLQDGETWRPAGCGFLVSDRDLVWLVTTRAVLERVGEGSLSAWVSRAGDGVLLGLGKILDSAGLPWLEAERGDVVACVFPVHEDWDVKAFPLAQALPPGKLSALMRVHAVSFPYGMEGFDPRNTLPILLPGGVAGVDPARARILSTAPGLPLNEGAPLVLAAGPDTELRLILAGVMTGPLPPARPVPPNSLPAALAGLSTATPIDVVTDLLRSAAATEMREKVLSQAAGAEG